MSFFSGAGGSGAGGSGADTDSFNALSQEIESIKFKNGNTVKASLQVVTEQEITDILNSLT